MKKPHALLPRLQAALEKFNAAQAEIAAHAKLGDAARVAVADFAANGDLRDLDAIALIAPRQCQFSLIEQRMNALHESAAAADQELGAAVEIARDELRAAVSKIRCGMAEKAAQAMKQHFDSLQLARRQALASTAVKEKSALKYKIDNLGLNEEFPEVAETFLAMAPDLFGEVSKLENELDGPIPEESELIAI